MYNSLKTIKNIFLNIFIYNIMNDIDADYSRFHENNEWEKFSAIEMP
jgi:hypothetical protein